jgi:hypothetical protein
MNRRELFRMSTGAALSGAPKAKASYRSGWACASVEFPARALRELIVSVNDSDGNPVLGLTAADFAIIEDGEEREISAVVSEKRFPVCVGVPVRYRRCDVATFTKQLRLIRGLFVPRTLLENEQLRSEDSLFLSIFGPEFADAVLHDLPTGRADRSSELLSLYASARELPNVLAPNRKVNERRESTLDEAVEQSCFRMKSRPGSQNVLIFLTGGTTVEPETTIALRNGGMTFFVLDTERGNPRGILGRLRRGYRLRYIAARGCGQIDVLVRGSASVRAGGVGEAPLMAIGHRNSTEALGWPSFMPSSRNTAN